MAESAATYGLSVDRILDLWERYPGAEFADQLRAASAALTPPAKVGGDEREALIQSLKNAQEWIAASRDRCDEIDGARWDALQRVIDFLARAALSADSGKNAERYRWLRARVFADRGLDGLAYFALPLPEPVRNPMSGLVAQHFDEAIDAAIAAKAKGDA
ncbi:hypothetical protein [Pandoraea fibrosis]|uniref:Uncharacterized protein n=1 Tax=Pandoraea fibrosis TaxID=1891094 RepID=A0A5E4SM68_9BURK|nr:hypothetical protein [Pandoraea fibrosis]VVD74979.1 hypothetical protein PFI31113_00794 [Pandoraea fibrosis]